MPMNPPAVPDQPPPPRTILVVEDEPAVREFVTVLLCGEGFRVEQAPDGADAISALDAHIPPPAHYCLVLLDMMLPRVDGLGVLQHLARLGAFLPVIAMSANSVYLAAALEQGARDAIAKPFDIDGLLDVVQRACPAGAI